jgi:integrase
MAAKVRRDAKGIYWVVVHYQGRRTKKRVGTSKRVAEHVAEQIQASLTLGQFSAAKADERSVPFDSFAEDWLRREVELPIERGQKGHLAPGTARVYRLQVDVHLASYFGNADIRSIGLGEVQSFFDHCVDTGKPRSPKSIDMALNVLRLLLSHARGQGLVDVNPVESWKRGRPRRRSSSAALQVPPEKVLSAEELQSVLSVAASDYPGSFPLILFLADTGARFGEMAALRWGDVDLEARTARIARSFSSGERLGPTKTGRERTVELSERLCAALAELHPNVFPVPEDALVFPNQAGGFLQGTNFRARVFAKVIRKALGPKRHYTPHGLRHTWASLHMARGTPLKWIQEQGGWTTAKLLLDTYGHFMPSESRGFADALSATSDGPYTAPTRESDEGEYRAQPETAASSRASGPATSSTTPRSPIMHLTEPPPFLRNSETSTVIGVVPRSRTWARRWSETPAGITRCDSPAWVRVKELAA